MRYADRVVADVVVVVVVHAIVVDVVVAVVVVLRGQTANRRVADHAVLYCCDKSTPAAVWQCPG